ncbi:MAG: efflux RND transporter periplasmic adaptor subunit [Butyrivibrio sp.]|jgi:HlyD family secretion protein|nr:efflux RND transporter periplasmic adaptor subunit [Butyrivibrio sp.]
MGKFLKSKGKSLKKHLTLIIVVVIVLIVTVFGVMYAMQGESTGVVKVKKGTITDQISETGIVKSARDQSVTSAVSGAVLEIKVEQGSKVKKGDVIATIDPSDLQTQSDMISKTIDEYQARIRQTGTENKQTKASLQQDIDQLKISLNEIEVERQQELYLTSMQVNTDEYLKVLELNCEAAEKGYKFSKTAYSSAQSAYDGYYSTISKSKNLTSEEKAQAEAALGQTGVEELHSTMNEQESKLNAAREELYEAQQRISQLGEDADEAYILQINASFDNKLAAANSQIAYLQTQADQDNLTSAIDILKNEIDMQKLSKEQIKRTIGQCTITAPCDGTISALPVISADRVTAGDEIAEIKKDVQKTIECKVLTSSEPYLKVGDRTQIIQQLTNDSNSFTGTIKSINDYAEETTSSLGLKEYRVKVVIEPEDKFDLLDGSDVTVKFDIYRRDNVEVLPISTIKTEEDKYYVYKVTDGKLVKTEVKVGHKTNSEAEIDNGLTDGDLVVTEGNSEDIEEGMKVEPVQSKTETE